MGAAGTGAGGAWATTDRGMKPPKAGALPPYARAPALLREGGAEYADGGGRAGSDGCGWRCALSLLLLMPAAGQYGRAPGVTVCGRARTTELVVTMEGWRRWVALVYVCRSDGGGRRTPGDGRGVDSERGWASSGRVNNAAPVCVEGRLLHRALTALLTDVLRRQVLPEAGVRGGRGG